MGVPGTDLTGWRWPPGRAGRHHAFAGLFIWATILLLGLRPGQREVNRFGFRGGSRPGPLDAFS